VKQLRRSRRPLAIRLRTLPVGSGFLIERLQLFSGDERVDLRDDEKSRRAEERHRAIRIDDRGQLRSRLERFDGDSRIGGDDRVAQIVERALGEILAGAADEDGSWRFFLRDLRQDGR
jgi:hypothetical protein